MPRNRDGLFKRHGYMSIQSRRRCFWGDWCRRKPLKARASPPTPQRRRCAASADYHHFRFSYGHRIGASISMLHGRRLYSCYGFAGCSLRTSLHAHDAARLSALRFTSLHFIAHISLLLLFRWLDWAWLCGHYAEAMIFTLSALYHQLLASFYLRLWISNARGYAFKHTFHIVMGFICRRRSCAGDNSTLLLEAGLCNDT